MAATSRGAALRRVALRLLAETFHGLTDGKRSDLATSLIRQWLTNSGQAFVLFPGGSFVFHLCWQGDLYRVTRERRDGPDLPRFAEALGLAPDDVPALQHGLNVRQCAEFRVGQAGTPVLVSVDPASGRVTGRKNLWHDLLSQASHQTKAGDAA
ncbi:MAG: hypothetical protein K2W96_18225 [Gemmataceae bacterium]|nr:hypothetical protein [Gemmataceae bacterium]